MSDWISVKDSLPDLKVRVLACQLIDNRCFWGSHHYFVAYFDNRVSKNEIAWGIDCGCSGVNCMRVEFEPTHWMPLPSPPEE